jgi:hypothetical protein
MMRKYSLATVALSAFLTAYAHAEFKFGALGGGNFSTWTAGSSVSGDLFLTGDTYAGDLSPSGGFGYQLGGLVRWEENNWGIEANVLYTSRSAKWHGNVVNQAAPGNSVRLSYEATMKQIQVPIMGTYKYQSVTKQTLDSILECSFHMDLEKSMLMLKPQTFRAPFNQAAVNTHGLNLVYESLTLVDLVAVA